MIFISAQKYIFCECKYSFKVVFISSPELIGELIVRACIHHQSVVHQHFQTTSQEMVLIFLILQDL